MRRRKPAASTPAAAPQLARRHGRPCGRLRSHTAAAAFHQAASWSRSQAGRPARPGPRPTWRQAQVQEALRRASPGGGPGGVSCFCSAVGPEASGTQNFTLERCPQTLGPERGRVASCASRDRFPPPLSPGSRWLPKSTPPAHSWNQVTHAGLSQASSRVPVFPSTRGGIR